MLTELSWLPQPPSDFGERIRALKRTVVSASESGSAWDRLVQLSLHALDDVQLSQLARITRNFPDAPGVPERMKLAIVGDGTLSLYGPPIIGSALRRNLRLDVIEGGYGSAMSDALNPASDLRRAGPDLLLIACDRRPLGLDRAAQTVEQAQESVDTAFATIRSIADNMRPSVKGTIFVQTIVPAIDPLFGSFDAAVASSPYMQVQALNGLLAEWAGENHVVLVDIARLSTSVGLECWDDPKQWHAFKLPFASDMIPLYSDFIARSLGAVLGKSRKCLVLDLDNTLWGGVIGDDGLKGIEVGQGSAPGEAYLAIQKMALDLRNRGVILAVCSKNEEFNARLPFQEHSEMVLRENHIAHFCANWVDKAANLKSIADALNIGLDSLVFLDDNPAERAQVRDALPMVAVPELPADPALIPRAVMAAGYFETVSFTEEDANRANAYQANAERVSLAAQASNLTEYLKSLAMTCTISHFDSDAIPRIAQLINKTNQFNLTTRRYSEAQLRDILGDPLRHAIQVRLSDKFGNSGTISVLIAEQAGDTWSIETWLMSCRVLGRRVEEAVLASLVAAARAAGARKLFGRYLPTAKNGLVRDHYEKLGFGQTADDSGSLWVLALDDYRSPDLPIQMVDKTRPKIDVAA